MDIFFFFFFGWGGGGGLRKIGLDLGVISMYLSIFSEVNIQNGYIFGVTKNHFFWMFDMVSFGVNSRCWIQAYV